MKFIICSFWIGFLLQRGSISWARSLLTHSAKRALIEVGCKIEGVAYVHGANVPSISPCILCKCNYGIVTCITLSCVPPPTGCRFSPTRQKCCEYECGCKHNGVKYYNGDYVPMKNPCTICKCINGTGMCTNIAECAPPMRGCERVYSEEKCCAYECNEEPDCKEVLCEPPPQGCSAAPQPHDCCAYTCCPLIDCTKVKCEDPPEGCKTVPNKESCCDFECYSRTVSTCTGVICPPDLPKTCTYKKNSDNCCAFSCRTESEVVTTSTSTSTSTTTSTSRPFDAAQLISKLLRGDLKFP